MPARQPTTTGGMILAPWEAEFNFDRTNPIFLAISVVVIEFIEKNGTTPMVAAEQPGVRLTKVKTAAARSAEPVGASIRGLPRKQPAAKPRSDREEMIVGRGVLELAGVEFIDANGGGPGVRLRENKPRK